MVLAARREAELNAVAEEIRGKGGRADVCQLDCGDTKAVQDAVAEWGERTGGLDLVIANAGVGITGPAHKLGWEHLGPVLQVNVLGAFATLHAAMTHMLPRGKGTIVGVSSLASMRGLPASGAYSASKAALATFLETLRIDLKRKGLTVVDVRPGFVDTAMTQRNRFKMPFLMNVEDAAKVTLAGIDRGDAVVAYPWPTAAAMSMAEAAPGALWRVLASKVKMS